MKNIIDEDMELRPSSMYEKQIDFSNSMTVPVARLDKEDSDGF